MTVISGKRGTSCLRIPLRGFLLSRRRRPLPGPSEPGAWLGTRPRRQTRRGNDEPRAQGGCRARVRRGARPRMRRSSTVRSAAGGPRAHAAGSQSPRPGPGPTAAGTAPPLTPDGSDPAARRAPARPTLQCVVLTGSPTLEAITTVNAEASSMVKPLRRGQGTHHRGCLGGLTHTPGAQSLAGTLFGRPVDC